MTIYSPAHFGMHHENKMKKKHNGNSISNDVIVLVIFETFSISRILRKCKI